MTEPASPIALARRLAGFGLREDGASVEPVPVAGERWRSLLARLVAQRLTGLAVAAAEAGWLRLADRQANELLGAHRAAMLSALRLEQKLLSLTAAFEEAALDVVALKGPAVAHAFYPEPSWRPFGDLDLLVRTRDWRRACGLLSELGCHRALPEPRRGFDERFGKGATHDGGDGIQVDLHRTLVLGPFGLWLDPDELFERTVRFELAGTWLQRLDDTVSLLHASLHASLGARPPLLMPLRDVAQITERGAVAWGDLADLAVRWRIRAAIRYAFLAASEQLGFTPPEEARPIMTTEPDPTEQRALQAYTTARRARGGTALATIRAIPGLRAKGSYVRALLLPDPAFLEARGGGRGTLTYLQRWAIPVRWLTGRGRRFRA